MTPYFEIGPNKASNLLSGSCELVLHLHRVGNVVDMGSSVLIFQAILLPFKFSSIGLGSLGVSCVSPAAATMVLASLVLSLAISSGCGKRAHYCC